MDAPGPIVFFGTPAFAVPTLESLFDAGIPPALVVTQPARPVGRGRRVMEPPVARRARQLELSVELVGSVGSAAFLGRLTDLEPWLAIVVAFGQIFPRSLLELPAAGCVNLHASLLPSYRGAAPIQAAIAAGEATTGVTTMRMGEGLDSGPILLQESLDIGPEETTPELAERLAALGASLIVRTVEGLASGDLAAVEQDETQASFAPKLRREDGEVDWRRQAREIFDRWRAFTPWPGLTARLYGRPLKLCRCSPSREPIEPAEPGTVITAGTALTVACGRGSGLVVEAVQRPNRGVLEAREFVNGEHVAPGDRFDPPTDSS